MNGLVSAGALSYIHTSIHLRVVVHSALPKYVGPFTGEDRLQSRFNAFEL